MTRRAPAHRVAHFVPPRKGDSFRGIDAAADAGFGWIDCNFLISRDGVVFSQHGSPYGLGQAGYLAKSDKRRVKDLTADELQRLKTPDGYVLRTAAEMFRRAARERIAIEFEAKDDKRFTRLETWERLAHDAEVAWGPDWQHHVVVKVLTNLSGGVPYALAVCKAAHEAGFRTMVLPRGRAKWRRFREPYVTYRR